MGTANRKGYFRRKNGKAPWHFIRFHLWIVFSSKDHLKRKK